MVKAVNTGLARLAQEVFQNVQKINAHNKDQAQLLRQMLDETIKGFNERIYTLSEAHYKQRRDCQSECRQRTLEEVARALTTESNLPLAETLSKDIKKIGQDLKNFEVPTLTSICILCLYEMRCKTPLLNDSSYRKSSQT